MFALVLTIERSKFDMRTQQTITIVVLWNVRLGKLIRVFAVKPNNRCITRKNSTSSKMRNTKNIFGKYNNKTEYFVKVSRYRPSPSLDMQGIIIE